MKTIGTIAAQQAIEAHTTRMGIDGDIACQAWHLVLSLREFCAVNGISFDELLTDTQRHLDEFPEDFRHMHQAKEARG